jgi:hypothetical protein
MIAITDNTTAKVLEYFLFSAVGVVVSVLSLELLMSSSEEVV